MNINQIQEQICFKNKGIVTLGKEKFCIGEKTSALNLKICNKEDNHFEFVCFSKFKYLEEESNFWNHFNNNYDYYNYAGIIYKLFEQGKKDIAIKNIAKFKVNCR